MPLTRRGFSFGRVLNGTLWIVGLVALFLGVAWRLAGLQQEAAAARAGEEGEERVVTEDAALFRNLLDAGLITPRDDTGLDMAPSDHVLTRRARGEKDDDDEGVSAAEQARLLEALYQSAPGIIVRTQVRLWNESRRIVAIRDNRPLAAGARAEWRAMSESGHPIRVGSHVPETFGFIHKDGIVTGFHEWLSVSSETRKIVFRSRITVPTAQEVRLHVVGEPVALPAGARVEKREVAYHEIKALWPCRLPSKAAIVRVPLKAGDNDVSIVVDPAVNCAPRIFGLAISMAGEDLAGLPPRKKPRKGRKPKPGQKDPGTVQVDTVEWTYNWRPVKRATPAGGGKFVLKTVDGVALTDPNGKPEPTDAAHELGLLPLVGFGPSDASSLIGMLAQSRLPPNGVEISLTIDSRVQKIVQGTVSHYLSKVFVKTRYDDERKAAVLVLDADTGAILGIGGWPLPPKGAQPWDYVSFAQANPLRDPMSIMAWEVIDKHNTPGSTFKPLLALALMRDGNTRVNRIMLGMGPQELATASGLNVNEAAYHIPGSNRSIGNFGNAPLARNFGAVSRAAECDAAGAKADPNFGLKQAVQFSINMWFARLAVMLEEQDVEAWIKSVPVDRAGRARVRLDSLPVTRLMKSMALVGLDHADRMDLAANVPASFGLVRAKSRLGADVLFAQTPKTHITAGEALLPDAIAVWKVAYLHRIALNGIGQGWSVSSLQMARGTGSIASGRRIQPHIFAVWGGQTLPPPPAPALDVDPALLDLLRAGMKAVPEAPGSTAVGTFAETPSYIDGVDMRDGTAAAKPRLDEVKKRLSHTLVRTLKCRAYGKTGTADIAKTLGYNSGWFIGWKDPVKPGGRRIAFACMTTHAMGPFRFGGTSCGRIMRDILIQMEMLEAPEMAAKDPMDKPPPPGVKPATPPPAPPGPVPGGRRDPDVPEEEAQ
jgi:cell division protein FtsI/penicillin-binding protein 2